VDIIPNSVGTGPSRELIRSLMTSIFVKDPNSVGTFPERVELFAFDGTGNGP
jgi:hypothetical protein